MPQDIPELEESSKTVGVWDSCFGTDSGQQKTLLGFPGRRGKALSFCACCMLLLSVIMVRVFCCTYGKDIIKSTLRYVPVVSSSLNCSTISREIY